VLKTIDIHTHLLNPQVRFERFIDRVMLPFFARRMGVEPAQLNANPFEAFLAAMLRSVRGSRYVAQTCLFGVDSRLDEAGREIHRDPTVCAMTEDVLAVAERYPDAFIPFLSVNPRRPDALERIDAYVERGCRGAKLLQNYWRVDLNDTRFIPYYERLATHRLPMIVHIGSEYSIQSDSRYERVDMLELPLACGVKVIAAHMGLGRIAYKLRFWRNLSPHPDTFDADYFILLEKLASIPNLYADISAILAPFRARALRHLSAQQQVHDKLLFGTDYPVPFTVQFNSYDLSWSTRKRLNEITNPFDRYTESILQYFPANSPLYTNHQKVLPLH
jgi:predicted TIM-barrel fold metal-dependent hydrolase